MDPIALNVTEIELSSGGRVFIAPMQVKNRVSIEGSVLGGTSMLPRSKQEVPALLAELLDAGTKYRTKDEIRDALSARGASLSFCPGVDRMIFSGSCFPEDLPFLLSLLTECLSEASIPAKEIESARKRLLGGLEEEKSDTRIQASTTLSQILFPAGHVNRADSTKTRMENVKQVTRTDLTAFQKSFGQQGLVVAITGDIEVSKAEKAARKAFAALKENKALLQVGARTHGRPSTVTQKLVPIRDKANIDTYFGVSVPFTYDSPEFLAFTTLLSLLGGRGLTAHLMSTIRERDGYTYGIYTQQVGFLKETEGAFRIWATFSPENFDKAVAATKKEINTFIKTAISEEALEKKKDEMIGRYLISLSTTRGFASALHTLGVEEKPLSYLDAYPSLIRALTLSEIKALTPVIAPEKLSIAASGTFLKK